jgi:hypothetical protein
MVPVYQKKSFQEWDINLLLNNMEVIFIRNLTGIAILLLLILLPVPCSVAADTPEEGLPGPLIGTWTGKSSEDGYGETYVFSFRPDGILELEELLPDGKISKNTAEYEVDGKGIRVMFSTGFFAGKEGLCYSYTLEGNRLILTANVENVRGETVIFERKQSEDIR